MKFTHQKTVLSDGFNDTVGSKLSTVPRIELFIIYHNLVKLSNKNTSVERTGVGPASSIREIDSLPLTYRPNSRRLENYDNKHG